jgi:WD40 repeat protein
MSHIFISYSRKDLAFAQKIVDALAANDLDTWIDWKSIPKGEDWEQEIYRGIEEADAFLFLLSPDSVVSEMCNKELDHAVKNGKRILPIVIRDTDPKIIHPEISKRNWIFCREGQDDFNKAIEEARKTIHTDYEWLKFHTDLQVKALKWEQKKDNSRLLRGKELREAEQRLVDIKSQVDPQPTRIQREYLLLSRRNEERQRRRILAAVIIGSVVMLIITVVAIMQRQIALKQQRISRARELSALSMVLTDSLPQRRLLLAISALNNLKPSDPHIPLLESNLRDYLDGMGGIVLDSSIISNPAAFSPDGYWLVARDNDSQVKAWNVQDLTAQPKVLLDQSSSGWLAIGPRTSTTPGVRWLVTGGNDSLVLWNLQDPERNSIHLDLIQHEVDSIAFSPDGNWLAVGENLVVEIWDLSDLSGKPYELEHEVAVTAMAFSRDGNQLATGTFYGRVRLWDMQRLVLQRELTSEDGSPISSMAFSADGDLLAVGSEDTNVQIWNIQKLATEPLYLDYLDGTSLAFSPNDQWFATGGGNTTIQLWDVQNSFAKAQTLKGFERGVTLMLFSPDSQRLVAQDGNGITHLLNMHELFSEPMILNEDPGYYSLDFVKIIDDRWIVANSWDQPIRMWDMHNPQLDPIILRKSSDYTVGDVVVSPNRHWLAAVGEDQQWEFWNLQTPTAPSRLKNIYVPTHAPNGAWLLVDQPAGDESILDMDNPFSTLVPLRDFKTVYVVEAVSDDGRWLMALDESGSPLVWDVQNPGKEPFMLLDYGEVESMSGAAFSPDGRWFAEGSNTGKVKVWDLQDSVNGSPRVYDTETNDRAFGLEFSPDKIRLAIRSGFSDAFTLQIVNLEGSSLEKVFESQPMSLSSAEFSHYGKWLAFGGFDGIVQLVDMQATKLNTIRITGQNNQPIEHLSFSLDENWLVSTGRRSIQYTSYGGSVYNTSNDIVFVWDLRKPYSDPIQLPGRFPLDFSSDSKWLSLSSNTGFHLWRLDMEEIKKIACQIVGRNFTWEEWQLYFSGEKPYKTCGQWPSPVEPTPISTLTP